MSQIFGTQVGGKTGPTGGAKGSPWGGTKAPCHVDPRASREEAPKCPGDRRWVSRDRGGQGGPCLPSHRAHSADWGLLKFVE